jgi:hypothetical protein
LNPQANGGGKTSSAVLIAVHKRMILVFKGVLMKKAVWMFAACLLLWSLPAGASTVFYDSFTRTGELVGTSPDTGGGAYVYVPTLPGFRNVKEGTGGSAHLEMESNASGQFHNFSIRSAPTGLNYAYSPTFYMTATFNSSDLSERWGGHLGVEVGINVWDNDGTSRVRQQQIGLGQSGWYGDLAAAPHTVAWGSGTQFGRYSLGDYTLGDTVTLAMKFEEKPMNLQTLQYMYKVYAGVVSPSGAEPTWVEIAGESGRLFTYSVDYIGLIVGGIDGGVNNPQIHSGYIDEIRIGNTWADVNAVPLPGAFWLLASGVGALAGWRVRSRKK